MNLPLPPHEAVEAEEGVQLLLSPKSAGGDLNALMYSGGDNDEGDDVAFFESPPDSPTFFASRLPSLALAGIPNDIISSFGSREKYQAALSHLRSETANANAPEYQIPSHEAKPNSSFMVLTSTHVTNPSFYMPKPRAFVPTPSMADSLSIPPRSVVQTLLLPASRPPVSPHMNADRKPQDPDTKPLGSSSPNQIAHYAFAFKGFQTLTALNLGSGGLSPNFISRSIAFTVPATCQHHPVPSRTLSLRPPSALPPPAQPIVNSAPLPTSPSEPIHSLSTTLIQIPSIQTQHSSTVANSRSPAISNTSVTNPDGTTAPNGRMRRPPAPRKSTKEPRK
ncbi:hypothetical protein BC830DRAFT_1166405 [Chytriomyces sp. MP71]|nr:hypothetical protein BC830DRAFT_1166405 [Chytriomyces sp. MP71]